MLAAFGPANIGLRMMELSSERLRTTLSGARRIYVSACSAEIETLPSLLDEARIAATVTGIFSPLLNRRSYASRDLGRRCATFFLNHELRQDLGAHLIDFYPWSYAKILDWCSRPGNFDAAVVMVSPPNALGTVSFGTQSDFLPDFYQHVGVLIGVINPQMPDTSHADSGIDINRFTALFTYDQPLLAMNAAPIGSDSLSETIAGHVAALIPDGATLQIGIGRIPQAVVKALLGHRELRIHSGMIDDSILALEAAGALSPDHPVVTGVAIGSGDLYRHLHRNGRYRFMPASYTHSPRVIAAKDRFYAINGALEVDLFGQINSEAGSGRMLASPGGLPEFVRGARASEGGIAIVAVRAKASAKTRGGIVAKFESPSLVTLPRSDVDFVVTENGVADLRDLPIDAKAQALIQIADPDLQEQLSAEWREVRSKAFA